ncbi:MAG: winged helix-turn-helix domain-containing protein [Chloroflexota bacterium]
MITNRDWSQYQITFRQEETAVLAQWVQAGVSGAVVGLPGAGKSNLLGFFCHRPEVVGLALGQAHHLPASACLIIPVDLNNLPDPGLATFYRVILRAFYEMAHQIDPPLHETVVTLYETNLAVTDPFVTQSALRHLLRHCQQEQTRVVLVLDGFDDFCRVATPAMTNTLRGLRDSFKDHLCYIVGMDQEAAYLPDPTALGELYKLLDIHVCWVGAMNELDARQMIRQETALAGQQPDDVTVYHLLQLTGGYPALLKAACYCWLTRLQQQQPDRWADFLLEQGSIQYRLQGVWQGLNQEEQLALCDLGEEDQPLMAIDPVTLPPAWQKRYEAVLARLAQKRILQRESGGYRLFSPLFARFVATVVATVVATPRGRIWLEPTSGQLYQGHVPLTDLRPQETQLLTFLVKRPYQRHTKSDLIYHVWPDEQGAIRDDSLYQLVTRLRQAIEPNTADPQYLLTWRGRPEGGYQFYPEGHPGQRKT